MNRRILFLAVGTFIIGTDDFVIAGILPTIAEELSVSVAAAGQLVTAFAVAYAVGAPVLGMWAAKLPVKPLLIASLIVFALANGAAGLAGSFKWLFAMRIAAALAASLFTPLSMAASASLVPAKHRGRALSMIMMGITLGLVLGAPIGTWIGYTLGWRNTFLCIAVVSLVTVLVLLRLPALGQEPASRERVQFKQVEPAIWGTLAVSILATAGGFMTYTYIAPILTGVTDVQQISGFLVLLGIGALVGNLAGGWSADVLGAAKTLKLTLAGFALLLLCFSLLSYLNVEAQFALILAGLLILLWGIPGFGMNPAMNTYLISLNARQASVILSFSASALYMGIGLGAFAGGAVLRIGSVDDLGLISAVMVGGALAAFLFIDRYVARSKK